jgi:uncharacterized protein DUF4112
MRDRFKITPGGPEESVARLEALGRLMDGAFALPGTNIRLGLDAIIGLVPVAAPVAHCANDGQYVLGYGHRCDPVGR